MWSPVPGLDALGMQTHSRMLLAAAARARDNAGTNVDRRERKRRRRNELQICNEVRAVHSTRASSVLNPRRVYVGVAPVSASMSVARGLE